MQPQEELLRRITFNPEILGGKAILRGRRVSVEQVLETLAAHAESESLLDSCDGLESEDVQACLIYAARLAGSDEYWPDYAPTER